MIRAGHSVVEAGDAATALAQAKAERPDIILLDLGLPDRDGIDLIAPLKMDSDAALLIVSARDATEQKVAALDLGADDYVTKPFDTDELLARLRTAARHRVARPDDRVQLGDGAVAIDFRRAQRFARGRTGASDPEGVRPARTTGARARPDRHPCPIC